LQAPHKGHDDSSHPREYIYHKLHLHQQNKSLEPSASCFGCPNTSNLYTIRMVN